MVVQCGYCIPGVIMAAAALIDRNDSPTDEQIDAAITNICRCGIYPRLRESIRRAIRIKSGREQVTGAPPPGIAPADAARTVPALRAAAARDPAAAALTSCDMLRLLSACLPAGSATAHPRIGTSRLMNGRQQAAGEQGVIRCARH